MDKLVDFVADWHEIMGLVGASSATGANVVQIHAQFASGNAAAVWVNVFRH